MERKKSIGFRFLCIIAAFVVVFSCAVLYFSWSSSNAQMEDLLQDKANLALQFDLAIRSYVSETIRPFAQEHTEEDVFVPEVMSTSFVARSIFEKVRKEHSDYTIKFSSDNPRNPLNQAGPEELKIIEYFNNNPDAKRWSGKIKINGQDHIALFSARRMKKKCLQCHGDPKDAPASLIARYGDKAGFYRPVGEVVALDAVALPVKKYQSAAFMQAIKASLVMITGLALLLATVYYTFHRLIGRRLVELAEHLKNAAKQEDKTAIKPLGHQSNDEIGTVIESFNILADDLSRGTTSIDNLNREITERKNAEKNINAIFNSAPVGMMLANENTEVVRLNNEVVKMTGKDCDQLLGLQPGDIFGCVNAHTDKGGCGKDDACGECPVRGALARVLESDRPIHNAEVNMHLSANGRITKPWLIVSVVPTMINGHKHVVISFTDITKRRENEERLKKILSEVERFNRLMSDREERVIEMKKEINSLLAELDREPQYKSVLEGEEIGLSSDFSEKEV